MKGHPWAGCAVSVPCFKCRQQPDMFVGSLQRGECSSSQLAQAKGKAAEELKGVLGGQHDHPESPHTAHQRGEKPFNRLALMQHGQGSGQSQPREKGSRKHTHRARHEHSDVIHACTLLFLFSLFFFSFTFFLLLSWREEREQSQEKQISPTIPFRKFHFKPNQMMAAALGDV